MDFDVWSICDYRLAATLYVLSTWPYSDVFEIPSGSAPVTAQLRLEGLHIRIEKPCSRSGR